MLEFLKPRCICCKKRIDTKKCRDGIGGGFTEPICWKCVGKKIKEFSSKKGDKK